MYGIPNMKLEKQIIDRKIRIMEEEGVKFVTNTDIGKDAKSRKSLEMVLTEWYCAVVLPIQEISKHRAEMPKAFILQLIS